MKNNLLNKFSGGFLQLALFIGSFSSAGADMATGSYAINGVLYGDDPDNSNRVIRVDTHLNGTGDGTGSSNTFIGFLFTYNVLPSESKMPIRIREFTNGGEGIAFDEVSVTASADSSIPSVSISITSQTNVACVSGGVGSLTATSSSGTPNYSYLWSNGTATSNSITSLSAGNYTVTDNNGAKVTASGTVTESTGVVASTVVDSNVICNGFSNGGATAFATSCTMPYNYAWSHGSGAISWNTSLPAGTYTLTVTDANGCTVQRSNIVLTAGCAWRWNH